MAKYKLTWRDLTWNDFKIYLFGLFRAFIPKNKIKDLDELENFIQSKSAWVSQVTLYGYLKTRMGTRYVLHFENDEFMRSVNLAKWNIYAVALQDLTFFTFSYLKANLNYQDFNKAKEIFLKILDDETSNKMPLDIIEVARKSFDERLEKINEVLKKSAILSMFFALAMLVSSKQLLNSSFYSGGLAVSPRANTEQRINDQTPDTEHAYHPPE